MSLSPLPASRSVSPDSTRAVSEQAALISQLLNVSQQLACQHQSLAGECHKEFEARETLLATKDAEIERILIAEADLRQDYEQQLTVDRQQWCLEKDALQKVLQEQQGTAHALEQHLNAQIAKLQASLDTHQSGRQHDARMHQDTIAALQVANEQLQHQQSKLEQDLKAALAYRHKCIRQKQELQLFHKQANQGQRVQLVADNVLSDDQQADLSSEQQPSDATSADDAASQEDLRALVVKLKRERELVKRAYNEEKKKADRYRNAYTQLRDLKQPTQRRSKQRSACGAQSMPQLAGLTRQQGIAVQLASCALNTAEPTAACTSNSSKPQKPFQARKGPTQHNCFTAEMDLAAAGLLGQAPKPPVNVKASSDKLQHGLSWPFRNKRVLQQEQDTEQHQQGRRSRVEQQQQQQQVVSRVPQRQNEPWKHASRQQQQQQQQEQEASSSEELSPGAKEALILAGLLSEEQEPMLDSDTTEEPRLPAQQPLDQQQPPAASGRHELQPWQARLAGHAEGIQQLDRDSLCRLSDPCHQPSKRSRSCPPDSFGAQPLQPADSTDAVHAMQSDKPDSDCDDAMSAGHSDSCRAGEAVLALGAQGAQQRQRDAVSAAQVTGWSARSHAAAAEAAPQHDSLDMTQPNLTPAGQRQQLESGADQPDSDPKTAPIRPFPTTSPRIPSANFDPDLDCDMLPAAELSNSNPQQNPDAAHMPGQSDRLQQHALGRQASAPPRVAKVKPAKWKQRAGQQAAAFGENDQPVQAPEAGPRQQAGAEGQQCWLQQGPGRGDVPTVLGETAQRARTAGYFRYQEVVRGKADRAALQGIQCLECRHFYEAVNTWGHEGQPLPACGHTLLPGAPTSRGHQQGAAAPTPARQDLHQDASRHRYRFAPPATPNGFWDMGFGDSQDSRI